MSLVNSGFRVWTRDAVGAPEYQRHVYCLRLECTGPVLYGYVPEVMWLRDTGVIDIELHYGKCGDPQRYVEENIKFKCYDCLPADWWIEPLGAMSPDDLEAVCLYVHFHCMDIEESEQW